MGLFRELGRQVGRFTTTAKKAAEEHPVTQCEDCGARFNKHHTQCPECNSENIIPNKHQK